MRRIRQGYQKSVEQDWLEEQPKLVPLPKKDVECFELLTPRVSKKSLITVSTNQYSIPIKLANCRVEVRLYAQHLECWHNGQRVAQHVRSYGKYKVFAALDHYLELLRLKPGAFSGSLPLAQAKANNQWPAVYENLLEAFINRYGQSEGTQAMIDCLLLHRIYSQKEVEDAVLWALNTGGMSVEVIALLVREHRGEKVTLDPLAHRPTLKDYDRPMSEVSIYNTLLKTTTH